MEEKAMDRQGLELKLKDLDNVIKDADRLGVLATDWRTEDGLRQCMAAALLELAEDPSLGLAPDGPLRKCMSRVKAAFGGLVNDVRLLRNDIELRLREAE